MEKKSGKNNKKSTEIIVLTEEDIRRNQERESTTIAKQLFLTVLEQSRGLISVVCQKVNISRATFYNWMKTDKEFAAKVREIQEIKPQVLKDRMFLEAANGNFQALKFMLTHIHPDFKKKPKTEKDSVVHIYHHQGEKPVKEEKKSYTALLYEEAAKKLRSRESLKKEFEGREFPPKLDGTPILETELFYYESYIRDWFKLKDLELMEEES
jgi:hypothetical protein